MWKKDWGIWAHGRWTRQHWDRGWCLKNPALKPPLEMAADAIPCHVYKPVPETAELRFYAPKPVTAGPEKTD